MALGFAASGCAVDTDDSAPVEEKVVQPSQEVFDYAPEGEVIDVPKAEVVLDEKGSISIPFGSTYTQALTITPGQTVTFTTSGGSVGVDPVLALFYRTDNSANFGVAAEYTSKIGINTLAFNDDTNGLHSSITFTNNRGFTLNARLLVFAYSNRTGTAQLTGTNVNQVVTIAAGGLPLNPGVTGNAITTGSVAPGGGTPDPWLFEISPVAVSGVNGDGFWNDDKANGVRDSAILGVHNQLRWFVGHGFNSGTTTVSN